MALFDPFIEQERRKKLALQPQLPARDRFALNSVDRPARQPQTQSQPGRDIQALIDQRLQEELQQQQQQPIMDERPRLTPMQPLDAMHASQPATEKYGAPIQLAPQPQPPQQQQPQIQQTGDLPQRPRIAPQNEQQIGEIEQQPQPIGEQLPQRPRLVPTSQLSLPDKLSQEQRNLEWQQDFENNPVVNNDRGVWGRIFDVFRQSIIAGGQTFAQTQGTPQQKLQAAMGGMIAGGLEGGFNPKVDEQRRRAADINQSRVRIGEYRKEIDFENDQEKVRVATDLARQKPEIEREKLRQKVKADREKFQQRQKERQEDADFKKGVWKLETDGEGKVWRIYPNDPSGRREKVINPETGLQDIDPEEIMYDTISPETRTPVRIKGRDLYSGESTIAAGNASRSVQVQTTNTNNLKQWEQTVAENKTKRGSLLAKAKAAEIEMQQLETTNQNLIRERNGLNTLTQKERIQQLNNQIAQNEERFAKLKGEKGGYETEANSIVDPAKPAEVSVDPVSVGQYSEAQFRQIMSKKYTPEQVEQLVTKAKKDKIIK